MDPVVVGAFVIPPDEIVETFSTSGGPGGQHANRSQTAVELRFDLTASEVFPETERQRLISRLGPVVTVVAADSRSQWRNRAVARQRLAERILTALRPDKPRRPTKPSRASRLARLDSKRRHGDKKRLRRTPDW